MPERVVQCHGCFDLLHIGHIRHFQAAKAAGDYLVVTITPDRFVNKGAGRPVFAEALRMEAVRALACVDEVQLTDSPTAADAIRAIRPAIFAKGPDYSAATLDAGESAALVEVGARLLITETEKWSSTELLPYLASPVQQYLAGLKAKYSASDVLGWLEQACALHVVVVGEAIRDEYHYCNTLGKAGKEPILAAQFVGAETFAGGAEAVASHVRAVSDHVDCLTGPPIVKRRFVERYPFQKLFEVYEMDEDAQQHAGRHLLDNVSSPDLMIVADYGHGLISSPMAEILSKSARSVAINVQANAGNHGFSTISKYPAAAFVSISERELRLDARDQRRDVVALMRCAVQRMGGTLLVTRGEQGCMIMRAGEYADAPALAVKTVDRIGAGDAVFGVTSCCAAVGMPLDLVAFVASVVGTLAVGIVGNARYIERDALHAAIRSYLA